MQTDQSENTYPHVKLPLTAKDLNYGAWRNMVFANYGDDEEGTTDTESIDKPVRAPKQVLEDMHGNVLEPHYSLSEWEDPRKNLQKIIGCDMVTIRGYREGLKSSIESLRHGTDVGGGMADLHHGHIFAV